MHAGNLYSIFSFQATDDFGKPDAVLHGATSAIKQFTMTGYFGAPLWQKLGIKPGMTLVIINEPINYRKLLGSLDQVRFSNRIKGNSEFVHLFASCRSELQRKLPIVHAKIADTGTIWVSSPKKSSGMATDLTEDAIRASALPLGLVDVKVCAIDEVWSGLKLMVRRENRKSTTKTKGVTRPG